MTAAFDDCPFVFDLASDEGAFIMPTGSAIATTDAIANDTPFSFDAVNWDDPAVNEAGGSHDPFSSGAAKSAEQQEENHQPKQPCQDSSSRVGPTASVHDDEDTLPWMWNTGSMQSGIAREDGASSVATTAHDEEDSASDHNPRLLSGAMPPPSPLPPKLSTTNPTPTSVPKQTTTAPTHHHNADKPSLSHQPCTPHSNISPSKQQEATDVRLAGSSMTAPSSSRSGPQTVISPKNGPSSAALSGTVPRSNIQSLLEQVDALLQSGLKSAAPAAATTAMNNPLSDAAFRSTTAASALKAEMESKILADNAASIAKASLMCMEGVAPYAPMIQLVDGTIPANTPLIHVFGILDSKIRAKTEMLKKWWRPPQHE